MGLKIGWDLFAGSSQAGTDSSVAGLLVAEVPLAGKYYIQVQRKSDDYYWDFVAEVWQAGAPTDAENWVFPGSVGYSGTGPAIRRLSARLPEEMWVAAASTGVKIWVYEDGGSPTSYIEMNFLP